MTDDDFGEERANLYQRIGHLEELNKRMTRAYSEEGLNEIALSVAEAVEDVFAQGGTGRTQRLARVQVMVREAMRANLVGEKHWNPGGLPNVGKPAIK